MAMTQVRAKVTARTAGRLGSGNSLWARRPETGSTIVSASTAGTPMVGSKATTTSVELST